MCSCGIIDFPGEKQHTNLLAPEREIMADQKTNITKVQLETESYWGYLQEYGWEVTYKIRTDSKDGCIKAHSSMGDNPQKLDRWDTLQRAHQVEECLS